MQTGQNEIRIIWFMLLIIIAIGAWWLDVPMLSYICAVAAVISVMFFVGRVQNSLEQVAGAQSQVQRQSSRTPLYIAALIAFLAILVDWYLLAAVALSVWVFMLLRWLHRLEQGLYQLQQLQSAAAHTHVQKTKTQTHLVEHILANTSEVDASLSSVKANVDDGVISTASQPETIAIQSDSTLSSEPNSVREQAAQVSYPYQDQEYLHQEYSAPDLAKSSRSVAPFATQSRSSSNSLLQQAQSWLIHGNPVLKAAIVVLLIGVVLLLRFATEHWQFSLAVKLLFVAGVSAAVTVFGYLLRNKNRSFALGVQGLGLAGLCLTLFFAYYNLVIPNLAIASLCFIVVMLLTLWLSLKQQSVELALMAMLIAYFAPFTLPVRNATAIEFIAYYLLINISVAILSSLRPWKYLNQIAFLMTVVVGGSYAFYHGYIFERQVLTLLVLAHAAIFIWLGFRFSQLLAQEDVATFQLKPILDLALIFGAPIVGYACLYLMYFEETAEQAAFSLLFAVVFAGLYWLTKQHRQTQFIAQSYFSLMLIFSVLIPPILLPEQWSVIGWALQGVAVFIFAFIQYSKISRYLALGLFAVAGLSGLYYLVELPYFERSIYWVLSLSYATVVVFSNSRAAFRQQLSTATTSVLCLMMLSATSLWLWLGLDYFDGELATVQTLLAVVVIYLLINEVLLSRQATWSWLLPKWLGLKPVSLTAAGLLFSRSYDGAVHWVSGTERLLFALFAGVLSVLWLRPLWTVRSDKEWLSLGLLPILAMASLTLLPQHPYSSVVILPLLFAAWCWWQQPDSDWRKFWYARSNLIFMLMWMLCSQFLTEQAFYGYVLPILNPFDLVSIAMLVAILWMLNLQRKTHLDQGLAAVIMVLSLLWLSSYVLLRALHLYLGTPINQIAVWQDATVQLSLTMLWVSLACIAMWIASLKQLRALWILGSSILVIVTLKLVLLDLSNIGTLMRVLSFFAAGLGMLLIAYIAPIPEPDLVKNNTSPSSKA
ncbi:membrane protein [Acinetobacter sp. KAM398]|uniref:DUF2339 domain-containing protein n=1 Tax=unclassified Acinetobacter TaxID=196816 RepID=UPI001F2CA64B|nr:MULTISPECIES: DUF2339 domain-containing protein [unclassified Acinetobacter]GJC32083.1 membrane protein [Acinetobacter sp. KAM392]GJC34941.1 membrane protein [Acinetobacter sp. KAM393]GJC37713.1 membrane protein [Acinetobacter sp. KAM394]GJC40573.1 membrane protein [Acinetobacter sp. KAM395]GJC43418.1 membrane protein [Acinetobacter sp. KAM396]